MTEERKDSMLNKHSYVDMKWKQCAKLARARTKDWISGFRLSFDQTSASSFARIDIVHSLWLSSIHSHASAHTWAAEGLEKSLLVSAFYVRIDLNTRWFNCLIVFVCVSFFPLCLVPCSKCWVANCWRDTCRTHNRQRNCVKFLYFI